MFIKLETIGDSQKAWHLKGGSWIPRSVLSCTGLKFPYYSVTEWYLNSLEIDNTYKAKKTLKDLRKLEVKYDDLPANVKLSWKTYVDNNYKIKLL